MLEPKKKTITGNWRRVLNKEIHNLFSPPSIVKMIRPRRVK
jgi:hypothetical protein